MYNTRHLLHLFASLPLPISLRGLTTSHFNTSPYVNIIPPAPPSNAWQHITNTLRNNTAARKIPQNHAPLVEQLVICLLLRTCRQNTPELRTIREPQNTLGNKGVAGWTRGCGSSLPSICLTRPTPPILPALTRRAPLAPKLHPNLLHAHLHMPRHLKTHCIVHLQQLRYCKQKGKL